MGIKKEECCCCHGKKTIDNKACGMCEGTGEILANFCEWCASHYETKEEAENCCSEHK